MDFWVADSWELETRELDWVKIWVARSYSLGFLTSADFEEVEVLFRSPDLLDFLLLSPPWLVFIWESWRLLFTLERDTVWEELWEGDRGLKLNLALVWEVWSYSGVLPCFADCEEPKTVSELPDDDDCLGGLG